MTNHLASTSMLKSRRGEPKSGQEIWIRPAAQADQLAVADLAALDSSATPRGEVLLAFVDGELRAALSQEEDVIVADPFRPTEDAVAMLRLRALQRAAAA